MKRANEVLVGGVVLGAILLAVGGSIWLSQASVGRRDVVREARFRTIGGIKKGDPVLRQGVRIGSVEDFKLGANNWVNVSLKLNAAASLPPYPVAIIASTTLFGDWAVQILSRDQPPDDPEVQRQLDDAAKVKPEKLPGATLPDVGQLTAQAGRIASDIALISGRVQDAFDSASAVRLRGAFRDLSLLSRQLASITTHQESTLTRIGLNLDTGTASLARSAIALQRTVLRADSATSRDQLQRIFTHADSITRQLSGLATDLHRISTSAASQDSAFARIIAHTDTIMARIEAGHGTLGMLTRDTTLYHESVVTVQTLRQMLQDMQRNPRRYFSFSVF